MKLGPDNSTVEVEVVLGRRLIGTCHPNIYINAHSLNKTKYFRLHLSDEVGTERPETGLGLT